MALPLMLGAGVDYTIFIQLALRRHGGDLGLVRRSVGRAVDAVWCHRHGRIRFAGISPAIPAWPASAGFCAVGIGANMIISVFLLPGVVGLVKSKVQLRWRASRSPKSKV